MDRRRLARWVLSRVRNPASWRCVGVYPNARPGGWGLQVVCNGDDGVTYLGVLLADRHRTVITVTTIQRLRCDLPEVIVLRHIFLHWGSDQREVLQRLLRRLHRNGVQGMEILVRELDMPLLQSCQFVECDVRPDRYHPTRVCYSPVYRLPGLPDGVRRLALVFLSDKD